MAKLTLADGTIFEGTTEELFEITQKFSGESADEPAKEVTHNGVEYTLVDRKAQEGDVVVFTNNTNVRVLNGKLYGPVKLTSGDNAIAKVYVDNYNEVLVYSEHFNRTQSNVLVYEPKAEPLKVGDYAVIVEDVMEYEAGDIVNITGERGDGDVFGFDFRVDRIGKDDYGYINADDLRKATDDEVTEAKALAERNAVFTQAGRKPNEYRKGDIVRVVDNHKAMNVKVGDIVVVNSQNSNGRISDDKYCYVLTVEPVTFAESRLDLRK